MAAVKAFDLAVVGGGIVGLATARGLALRFPTLSIAVLEKERELSMHQTGHNSGVIHAGIYYKEGSLKARMCVRGMKLMYEYADRRKVPYKRVGKLIVATDREELPRLDNLWHRAQVNKCPGVRLVEDPKQIIDIEPHCTRAIKAIHSPETGIIDYRKVCYAFAEDVRAAKGSVFTGFNVSRFAAGTSPTRPIRIIDDSANTSVECSNAVICAGLQCDRMYQLSSKAFGGAAQPKGKQGELSPDELSIVPFRGDYLLLSEARHELVRGNIYPVPDPAFPFLGLHFTPRMDGSVIVGPSAVLHFNREAYNLFSVNLRDTLDIATSAGLWKMAPKLLRPGMGEIWRSFYMPGSVKLAQRLIPAVKNGDLRRGPCGIRAQAISSRGELVDDFVFGSGSSGLAARVLHVLNAPSPAATSSLSIAEMVVERASKQFNF